MKFTTVIVTRNSAAHVKTLHTVLKLNIRTIRAGIQNELCFVNDDPFEIADVIEDRMKTCDRIVMIHYGVNIDEATIDYFCGERALEGVGVLVFPAAKEKIDWDRFTQTTQQGTTEPIHQRAIHFDTEVRHELSKSLWSVNATEAKSCVMNCKNVRKKVNKIFVGKSGRMFEKFREQGVKIVAYTAANVTMTFAHECVSNILQSSGVRTEQHARPLET